MAEAIVSAIADKIASLLVDEAIFLHGVKDEVDRLQAELKRMQCFLRDADRKQQEDAKVRNWVAEIRDVVYDAEDVIDAFLLKAANRGVGICKFTNRLTSIFTKALDLHDCGTKIKSIRAKLVDISNSLQTYGITFVNNEGEGSSSVSMMQRRLRRSDPNDEDNYVIIFERTTRELLDQLMREDDELRVVSIVGMGGLGKTTLAKQVYNRAEVKRHFDCYSWAFISQQFSPKDVLIGILMEVAPNEVNEKLRATNVEDWIVKTLVRVLKERRYLIVLDDIWKKGAWDSLKHAFPRGKKGSKVLFTTRIKEVALHANPWSSPVEPPFLTDEQGWDLLSRKAFPADIVASRNYEPQLERIGKEMVRQCKGLPLAIAVLGRMLANRPLKYWEVVQRDINTQFNKSEQDYEYGGVSWILALSYHDLPFKIKPCFLYLSQFPEDWEIEKKTLIRMWMAEGFVAEPLEEGDETMEDVGEQYFEELVNRCMVQVSERDHTGIGVKKCRLHDLMRDMCVLKAKEEKFIGVIEKGTISSTILHSTRRIAIHDFNDYSEKSFILLKQCSPHLRSLVYLSSGTELSNKKLNFIFNNFRLLRVLNLWRISLNKGYMSREIGNLIHLRYLGLRKVYFGRRSICSPSTLLPASIGNLKGLYTLDLRGVYSFPLLYLRHGSLPDVLGKLECLRHVLVDPVDELPIGMNTLRHLETLKMVKAKSLIGNNTELRFTNLRSLGMIFERREEVEVVLRSSFLLGRLRSLIMWSRFPFAFPNFEPFSGCHQLTKLILDGIITEDPNSLHHKLAYLPPSLSKLVLFNSRLKQDPLCILEKLPNLRFLWLGENSFEGSKMVCSAHGFRQLEILRLESVGELEEWEIQEHAMPRLKTLYLQGLGKMRMIPQGLKFVTTLQELQPSDVAKTFAERGFKLHEIN